MFTRIAFGKVGYVRLLRCVGICEDFGYSVTIDRARCGIRLGGDIIE